MEILPDQLSFSPDGEPLVKFKKMETNLANTEECRSSIEATTSSTLSLAICFAIL